MNAFKWIKLGQHTSHTHTVTTKYSDQINNLNEMGSIKNRFTVESRQNYFIYYCSKRILHTTLKKEYKKL